ncbi:MAG: NAD(P)/FAD-dependent oxidoreductase [Ilumatobacteraceae bacterium]
MGSATIDSAMVDAVIDAVIVGGGPSGAAAAITLARAGRSVVVIDKAAFPRDKCCGDGLTTLAVRELAPLGLDPSAIPNWRAVRDVWLRSPSGREVHLRMPEGGTFAATAPRAELDAALFELARRAGATTIERSAVVGVDDRRDHVVVTVDDGSGGRTEIAARFVVAADGMWSPTRKLLGLGEQGYLGEWHAVRQYASGVSGPAADQLHVWFEPDLLPGYAWSFPLPGGRVNLGYGVPRSSARRGADLRAEWATLLTRSHIAAALGPDVVLEGRHAAWPIPAAVDRVVLASGRVLFVGDAARATDVMTGEGIGQALLTGRLAAEAIEHGIARRMSDAASVARAYERTVRRELVADHRMSTVLNRMLARPLLARGAVRVVGLSDFTRRNFVRWMFEDEPRAVALTPRRWHRHFLRQPAPLP